MSQAQQEAEAERYSRIMDLLRDCLDRGVSIDNLITLRFECGIDRKDYLNAIEQHLKDKYGR